MKIGILGGGISGICLQHFLKEDNEVLETAKVPGGLCRTFFKDGFGFDLGGHILFTKNQMVSDLVDKFLEGNLNKCRRENKILYKGILVKYPFENGLSALGKEEAFDCLVTYLNADFPKPNNLKEWAYYTFGTGIAEKYFIPYNEKIWNIRSEELSLEFVDRIPKPPKEDVIKGAMGIETEGYLHQLYFKYPTHGGVESLVKAIIKPNAKITCNYDIKDVRKKDGKWHVSDGNEEKIFDKIVMSYPIHEAINHFHEVPQEVKKAVSNLRYNSMKIVMIAVNNESLLKHSALYIPDPDVICHRICFMGFFSKELVKPGTSSLIAEITTNPGDGIHELSNQEVIDRTISDLQRIGVLKKEDVILTDVKSLPYGYPVYNLEYRKNAKVFRDYFKSIGVELLGRFAEFEYINSDECIRRAVALADNINREHDKEGAASNATV